MPGDVAAVLRARPRSRAPSGSRPPPTVSLVSSSIRMNAPVTRLSRVRVGDHGRARAQRHLADVVDRQRGRLELALERLRVGPLADLLNGGADRAGGVLERVAPARRAAAPRSSSRPCSRARARPAGWSSGATSMSPRPTSSWSASANVTDIGGTASCASASSVSSSVIGRRHAGGEHDDLVAGLRACRRRSGPRRAASRRRRGAAHPLDRNPQALEIAIGLHVDLLEVLEQRRAVVERRVLGAGTRRCRRAAR